VEGSFELQNLNRLKKNKRMPLKHQHTKINLVEGLLFVAKNDF